MVTTFNYIFKIETVSFLRYQRILIVYVQVSDNFTPTILP